MKSVHEVRKPFVPAGMLSDQMVPQSVGCVLDREREFVVKYIGIGESAAVRWLSGSLHILAFL